MSRTSTFRRDLIRLQTTVDIPHIGHPQIGQVLKVTGSYGDGRAATCGPDIGQVLEATGLPGSGG
jgi:hypothetical protein